MTPHRSEGGPPVADGAKVVINLATGLEDPERLTVAFLVGGAAAEQGKQVAMFLTKEAVRLAVPGVAEVVACDGCPPLGQLFQQFAGKGGELFVCPICLVSPSRFRDVSNAGRARVANSRPLLPATPPPSRCGQTAATVLHG